MPDRKRKRRIFLLHIILLPSLLFAFYFFTLAPRSWTGVDEAVVEKIAKEHGREARTPLINTDQGDLLLFVFLLAGVVGGVGAGYWWRILVSEKSANLHPIGTIHSPYRSKEEAPIQGALQPETEGTVQLLAEYAPALQDIELFTHLILLYHFDRAGEVELVRPTFLDDEPHGVFASRHPCRPNGIGLSVVRLIRREGDKLIVAGVDVLDGTPLIDIKPYIPRFDCHPEAGEGWLAGKGVRPKPAGRE